MKCKKYTYHCYDKANDPDLVSPIKIESYWNKTSLDLVAEERAEDFYTNWGGRGSKRPLVFVIKDENFKFLGEFKVGLEFDLNFVATKSKGCV